MKWIEARVERQPESGCWLWIGHVHHSGYGLYNGKSAHRLVFTTLTGTDLTGKLLCHTCDVKHCVNPDHLFVGTQRDNMQDMYQKGRQPSRKGEANRTHLKNEDIIAIRNDTRKHKDIAADYRISVKQVSNIKTRHSWSHI